jgi:hypothetical protein
MEIGPDGKPILTPFERLAYRRAGTYKGVKDDPVGGARSNFVEVARDLWLGRGALDAYPPYPEVTWYQLDDALKPGESWDVESNEAIITLGLTAGRFTRQLQESFQLDELWNDAANATGIRAGARVAEAAQLMAEQVERKPEVEAALLRMKLIEPRAHRVYALFMGSESASGWPFNRTYRTTVRTGRVGRPARERQGYTPARLARILNIPKPQVEHLVAHITPLFREDMELFEDWRPEELDLLLREPPDPRAARAAIERREGGWLKG